MVKSHFILAVHTVHASENKRRDFSVIHLQKEHLALSEDKIKS